MFVFYGILKIFLSQQEMVEHSKQLANYKSMLLLLRLILFYSSFSFSCSSFLQSKSLFGTGIDCRITAFFAPNNSSIPPKVIEELDKAAVELVTFFFSFYLYISLMVVIGVGIRKERRC